MEWETIIKQYNLNIKKKGSDEPKFFKGYHSIMKLNCDSTLKCLLIIMMDDANVNKGVMKWKHQTYADKIGMSRIQVKRWFDKLVANHILLEHESNHAGSKQNKYAINLSELFKVYKKVDESTVSSR